MKRPPSLQLEEVRPERRRPELDHVVESLIRQIRHEERTRAADVTPEERRTLHNLTAGRRRPTPGRGCN